MLFLLLLVEDSYQYNVNRLLSGCAHGLRRPIARIGA